MRRPWWLAVCLACLSSLAFASAEGGDELDRNRRLLEKWKTDPEHYRRLKRDLAAFDALPAERQAQIRDVDRQLHETDPDTQARLWAVMERYSVWMEQLPEPERRAVLEAEDKVTVIRGLRQREWIERLPRAIRKELADLPRDKRLARINQLQLQERQHRFLWQRMPGSSDGVRPAKYKDLPKETQTFLEKELMPRLSDQEKRQLKQAEGTWPEFPKQLDWLAVKYPVLPEGPKGKITSAKQLPIDVKIRLDRSKKSKQVASLEGRWPDYALAVCDTLRAEGFVVVQPLGACRTDEFPLQTRNFVNNQLLPKLTPMERADLNRFEGRWPDYPRRLLMLARRHQMVIPGMSLPGPTYVWDEARMSRTELPAEQKRAFELIASDPKFNLDRLMKGANKKPPKSPHGKGHK